MGSAVNIPPFLRASAIFFERPRRFSRLPVLSMVVALRNKHDTGALLTNSRSRDMERPRQIADNSNLPATGGFARLGVTIDHPPGTLASSLVLHSHESAV